MFGIALFPTARGHMSRLCSVRKDGTYLNLGHRPTTPPYCPSSLCHLFRGDSRPQTFDYIYLQILRGVHVILLLGGSCRYCTYC
jgi:hypothetical protein